MSVPQLTASNIKKLDGIARRPVYFLNVGTFGVGSYNVTVKGEQKPTSQSALDGAISIKWGSKLMKNVNSSKVNTKIMDAGEIGHFKDAARKALKNEPDKLMALNEDLIWTKMPYVKGLTDIEVVQKGPNGYTGVPEKMKPFLKHFSDSKTWKQLGKILAVDIFIGNGDRFDIKTGDWVNKGNIMFQSRVTGDKMIGLDTFEAKGASSNLTGAGDTTALDKLNGNHETKTFLGNVIASIEGEFNFAMRKAGINSVSVWTGFPPTKIEILNTDNGYFGGYLDDLEGGFNEGVTDLKKYLVGKYQKEQQEMKTVMNPLYANPNGIPAGIIARMQHLNWI